MIVLKPSMHGESYYRPTYIGHTKNEVTAASITLTKPTVQAVESGDFLIILVANDSASNTAQWDDITDKPTEFTLVHEAGDSVSDVHHAIFYKIATGTEGATINVSSVDSANYIGYYIHIKGANASTPIGNVGAIYNANFQTSHTLAGVADAADDLGIFIFAFDGSDGTLSITAGDDWDVTDKTEIPTDSATGLEVFIGFKIYAAATAQDVTIGSGGSDGGGGAQFRINS